jgi:site-specific recombinase XerD
MFLRKRENGYYHVCYRGDDGTWRSVSTKTRFKAVANQFFSDLKHNLSNKNPSLSIQTFKDRYLEYSAIHHAKLTQERVKYVLSKFVSFVGNKMMDKVIALDIESYKAFRLKSVSAVTVNIELRSIKAFFGLAYRWDVIPKHPFKAVTMLRIPEHDPIYLKKDDFFALLRATTKPWLKNLIVIAVNTGLRRGELVNLKWEHIDLEKRILKVANTAQFQTKSKRERFVPLNLTAMALMEVIPKRSEFVFIGDRGRKLDDEEVSRRFKDAVTAAGLNPGLHLHSLRHTFATWLVQNGAGIYEVQKLLGHSTIQMTQIYTHLQPEQLHSTVAKIVLIMN